MRRRFDVVPIGLALHPFGGQASGLKVSVLLFVETPFTVGEIEINPIKLDPAMLLVHVSGFDVAKSPPMPNQVDYRIFILHSDNYTRGKIRTWSLWVLLGA